VFQPPLTFIGVCCGYLSELGKPPTGAAIRSFASRLLLPKYLLRRRHDADDDSKQLLGHASSVRATPWASLCLGMGCLISSMFSGDSKLLTGLFSRDDATSSSQAAIDEPADVLSGSQSADRNGRKPLLTKTATLMECASKESTAAGGAADAWRYSHADAQAALQRGLASAAAFKARVHQQPMPGGGHDLEQFLAVISQALARPTSVLQHGQPEGGQQQYSAGPMSYLSYVLGVGDMRTVTAAEKEVQEGNGPVQQATALNITDDILATITGQLRVSPSLPCL